MTLVLAVTMVLAILAAVATYFVARAALALDAMRKDAAELRKQGKLVLKQSQQTERTSNRIADKLYRQHQDIAVMLADPTVQRALRQEGRR